MRIDRIELTHARVPLVEPFRISSGVVSEKDAIVVRVESDAGVGWGESSPMAGSFYSADTPESCWRELSAALAPAAAWMKFDSPKAAISWACGLAISNFARTGIETALWDIAAKNENQPLYRFLGGSKARVESGLAVGLYGDREDMLRAIGRYLVDGYKRVKIKIEPGRDVALVRAVRRRFGDIPLYVDANGAYGPEHLGIFQALDEFDLMMFEQPFPGPMLKEMADLQRQVRTPVCLDESLESEADLLQAIELGSFQIANIKIQRVGGFSAALRIYEICRKHGIRIWVGTMPELGIGCAQAAALAALEHCTLPTDVEASSRWFTDDIIEPWLEVLDGYLDLPGQPGLGWTVNEAKLDRYRVATAHFGANRRRTNST